MPQQGVRAKVPGVLGVLGVLTGFRKVAHLWMVEQARPHLSSVVLEVQKGEVQLHLEALEALRQV